MPRPDQDYHLRRARAEFDLAQESICEVAAQAHIKLSGLHMERAKQLAGGHAEFDFGRSPLR